jgi:hypothetical protein
MLVDATGPGGGTGLGDESILTELEESFPGDEGDGEGIREHTVLYGCRVIVVMETVALQRIRGDRRDSIS